MNTPLRLLCASASLCVLACAPKPTTAPVPASQGGTCDNPFTTTAAEGTELAKIGDSVITVEAIERKINKMSPFIRTRYESAARKKEFVTHLMDRQMLAQEAISRGMHNDPKVLDTLFSVLAQELSRAIIEERVSMDAIDDKAIDTYYKENDSTYNKPAAVRVSHIYKAFNNDKNAAKTAADKVHASLVSGLKKDRSMFRTTAAQESDDDASKNIGGDLRYMQEEELRTRFGEAITKAIWNLPKINTMSAVVEGKKGFHIFRLTGRRHAHNQPLERVREHIRQRIYRDQRRDTMKAFLVELKGKFGTSLNEEKLADIKIAAPKKGAKHPPVGIGAGHGHGHGGKRPSIAPPKKSTPAK
jgi:peptidyl-prolyl cis-trans isomerase C